MCIRDRGLFQAGGAPGGRLPPAFRDRALQGGAQLRPPCADEIGGKQRGEQEKPGCRQGGQRAAHRSGQRVVKTVGQGDALLQKPLHQLLCVFLERYRKGDLKAVEPSLQPAGQGGQTGEQRGQTAQQQCGLITKPPEQKPQPGQQQEGEQPGAQGRGAPAGQMQPLGQQPYAGLQQGGQCQGNQKRRQPGQQETHTQPKRAHTQPGIQQPQKEARVPVLRHKSPPSEKYVQNDGNSLGRIDEIGGNEGGFWLAPGRWVCYNRLHTVNK